MTHDHQTAGFLADELDLDGEVLRSYWTGAFDLVRAAAPDPVRAVLDLGAGTGVGTIALAELFPAAEVTAVDVSDDMLDRIRRKASERGLSDRLHTLTADLDAEWPLRDAVDVTWASMSLHHLADPERVLADLRGSTRPGGIVAVAEFSEHLRFLPDDLGFGRPRLEERCRDLVRHEQAHELPHLGSDWAPRLTGAGFRVVDERVFAIDVREQSAAAGRYAHVWLQMVHARLAERLDDDDRTALARLTDDTDPESVLRRTDLHVRGERTVTVGQNPET